MVPPTRKPEPAGAVIDCSTIDVDSARAVSRAAVERGLAAADAPVSGGIMAAEGGSLAFMVGCEAERFGAVEAQLLLEDASCPADVAAALHLAPLLFLAAALRAEILTELGAGPRGVAWPGGAARQTARAWA